MLYTKLKLLALALLSGPVLWTSGHPTPTSVAAQPTVEPSSVDAAYEAARALVKPSDNEWQWRHIPWLQSVAEAQKRGAAEGKPIMLSGAAQGSVIGCL